MTLKHWNILMSSKWTVCAIAIISFAGGTFFMERLTRTALVKAESDRVFELRVYHALPGKLPAMESRFRETTSKLLAKHRLNVIGYWTSEDASASDNRFVFLLAHQSRDEARRNWDAMRTDPEFQTVIKSEEAEKTLENADVSYMRPTDFSPMK